MKLIALDIDGTVLSETGELHDDTLAAVARARRLGHEVMLATGRSVALTLPVLDRLRITPEYVVCANGAITLRRDPAAPTGYSREWVETFDPRETLLTIKQYLDTATFLVEDEAGLQLYLGDVPDGVLAGASEQVTFEQLLDVRATRVVVLSPDHELDEFLDIVSRMGLHQVSYNVGWAAWLDVAPQGVNKATALERVRETLGVDRAEVIAIGDGRNDLEMLQWAGAFGRGIAMGQSPDEVLAAASEVTGAGSDVGVAQALAAL